MNGLSLRFRLHKIALVSDIEKAFLQIGLQSNQRDVTSWLWTKSFDNYANKLNRYDILEADWVVLANDAFHIISEDVKGEIGSLDPKEIFNKWELWFKNQLKEKITGA